MQGRHRLGDHHAVLAQVRERTLRDVEVHHAAGGGRVDRRVRRVRTEEVRLTPRGGRHLLDTGHRLDRTDDRRAVARALGAGGRDEQVRTGLVGDHVTEGVLQRRGEDAHAHDQGEADHQGSSRRRRTTRVAHRVLLRQLPGEPAPPERLADHRGERTDGERQGHHHSDHHGEQGRSEEGLAQVAVQRPQHHADTGTGETEPDHGTTQRGLLGPGRRVAQRLDRQHLRRPAGRDERSDHGDERADQDRDPDRAGLELQGRARQAEPDRVHEQLQALRHREADTDTDSRGRRTEQQRLEQQAAHDLAPGAADGAQQRDLA